MRKRKAASLQRTDAGSSLSADGRFLAVPCSHPPTENSTASARRREVGPRRATMSISRAFEVALCVESQGPSVSTSTADQQKFARTVLMALRHSPWNGVPEFSCHQDELEARTRQFTFANSPEGLSPFSELLYFSQIPWASRILSSSLVRSVSHFTHMRAMGMRQRSISASPPIHMIPPPSLIFERIQDFEAPDGAIAG